MPLFRCAYLAFSWKAIYIIEGPLANPLASNLCYTALRKPAYCVFYNRMYSTLLNLRAIKRPFEKGIDTSRLVVLFYEKREEARK